MGAEIALLCHEVLIPKEWMSPEGAVNIPRKFAGVSASISALRI